MVADLEQRGNTVSMFSRRQLPWHQLGSIVPDDITATDKVLELAKLKDWNIRLEPRKYAEGYSSHLQLSDVVRDNPWYDANDKDTTEQPYNVLGYVGKRYEIVQNEELAEFAELLLPAGRWETAGSIRQGATVFMSMALSATVTIDEHGANETIDSYLVCSNSHDGYGKLTVMVTNVRPVCKNTLDYGLRNASRKLTFRHTKSLDEKMQAAKLSLNLATNYNDEFVVNAEALMAVPMTNNEYSDFITEIYPEPASGKKVSMTRWNQKIDDLEEIWRSDTIKGTPAEGNAWGFWNSIEEEFQWNRKVYKNKSENFWISGAGFDDEDSKKKTELFQQVNELVFS